MSWASIIPAVLQIGSGIAEGSSAVEQNKANDAKKDRLTSEAEMLATLASPLGIALTRRLLPGGDGADLLAAPYRAAAASDLHEKSAESRTGAYRYGGTGYGAGLGFLRDTRARYILDGARADEKGRREADRLLWKMYGATLDNDFGARSAGEESHALSDILGDLSRIRYR